jgi:hypothetical protein
MLLWKKIEDSIVTNTFEGNTDVEEAVEEGC